jgi:SAM-dependent methyltransferase
VKQYGDREWQGVNETLLDDLDKWLGGFAGKRVLDLGGGPGQYSAAFARRGAEVTWHDVSRGYRDMARVRIQDLGLAERVRFSLGYLEEAPALLGSRFDLVFNRLCWYYCMSDAAFARVVYRLVTPGGWAYVDTNHSGFHRSELSRAARVRTWLNDRLALKIGHPFPPHGRVARLFLGYPIQQMRIDYRCPTNDRVLFQKPGA